MEKKVDRIGKPNFLFGEDGPLMKCSAIESLPLYHLCILTSSWSLGLVKGIFRLKEVQINTPIDISDCTVIVGWCGKRWQRQPRWWLEEISTPWHWITHRRSHWKMLTDTTQEGRRELVLTGKSVEERVEKNGIDLKIFSLKPLNFLEVVKHLIWHVNFEF